MCLQLSVAMIITVKQNCNQGPCLKKKSLRKIFKKVVLLLKNSLHSGLWTVKQKKLRTFLPLKQQETDLKKFRNKKWDNLKTFGKEKDKTFNYSHEVESLWFHNFGAWDRFFGFLDRQTFMLQKKNIRHYIKES